MSAGLRASVGVAAPCLFILIALSDLEGSAFSFTSSTHSMVFFLLITSSGLEGSTFSFTSFADSWRFGLKGTERVLTSYASLIHIYMLSFTSSRARSDAHQGHAGSGSHLIERYQFIQYVAPSISIVRLSTLP